MLPMSSEMRLLMACAFIVLVGVLALTEEPAEANVEHDNYCARVAALEATGTVGHRDYLEQCGETQ